MIILRQKSYSLKRNLLARNSKYLHILDISPRLVLERNKDIKDNVSCVELLRHNKALKKIIKAKSSAESRAIKTDIQKTKQALVGWEPEGLLERLAWRRQMKNTRLPKNLVESIQKEHALN